MKTQETANFNFTVARPYAKAIVALASDENTLSVWSDILAFLSLMVQQSAVQAICRDPRYTSVELSHIFIDMIKQSALFNPYQQQIENLITLLAQYRRLLILPVIARLYEQSKNSLQQNLPVSLISAFDLSSELIEKIRATLEKKLHCKIIIVFIKDVSIIGGLVIRYGDCVIDLSVKNHLNNLQKALLVI